MQCLEQGRPGKGMDAGRTLMFLENIEQISVKDLFN